MATSVLLGTRPDWTRSTIGIPIDTIVRIHPGAGSAKTDLAFSRSRVSVSRVPGAAPRPEDEFEVGFVYGPEATTQDVAARSLMPLLRKFVDGYNVAVMAFGATGSGKTALLEGSVGRERDCPDGTGLVHTAVDELFKLLAEKAAFVGNALAERHRGPTARAFDFFLECSFVEVYREEVADLFAKQQQQQPGGARTALPIYEDVTEGYQVAGLTYWIARNSRELRTAFNTGRLARSMAREDVGNVHDRSAAIFTLHMAQFSPALAAGEEDRILVSKLQFVDLPGAERLAEDPEILRLREGPVLNRSLHALGATLRALAEGPGGGLAAAAAAAAAAAGVPLNLPPHGAAALAGNKSAGGLGGGVGAAPAGSAVGATVPFIYYEASALTKLLSDALGGNSLCLLVGTLRQGDPGGGGGLQAINTLQYLTLARAARNFPVINHGRSRGLLQKLRYRLMAVVEDRQALRELLDSAPAEGDPNAMALHLAKMRDLEARLIAVRAENAELREEKQAMQLRLEKLYKAEEGDMEDRQQLQDALIASEEQRLQLSRALIDFQMEFNDAKQEWETVKYKLEAKVIEAEAHEAELATAVGRELQELRQERDALRAKVAELGEDDEEEASPAAPQSGQQQTPTGEEAAAQEAAASERRAQRAKTIREKDRLISELQVEVEEVRRELEGVRRAAAANQIDADEVREGYRRRLEVLMREVGERGAEAGGAGSGPQELFRALQHLAEENTKVTEAREAALRVDGDEGAARLVELRRKYRALGAAYRSLRQQVEEQWPPPGPPFEVPSEQQLVGAALEAVVRSEEEADRRTINKLRDQVAQLQGQLETLRFQRAATELGLAPGAGAGGGRQPTDLGLAPSPGGTNWQQQQQPQQLQPLQPPAGPHAAAAAPPDPALQAENAQLRAEVEALRTRLQAANEAAAAATAAAVGAGGPDGRVRTSLTIAAAGTNAVNEGIIRQLREFNQKTTAELQRRAQQAETRATMAEEQLEQLQAYMNRASVSYQKEIVRLRSVIGQMEASLGAKPGTYLNMSPLEGQGGGGALRPAAEVLEEMATHGSPQAIPARS